MFFFRHLLSRDGFHPETRFSIHGWRHWIVALVTVGWWAAVTWLSAQAFVYTNLAITRLGQIVQRASLTPAEERHASATGLSILAGVAILVAMIAVIDTALRFCLEMCLWVASSMWRFAPFRRLASRVLEGVERKVLRRTPEWTVKLI